MKLNAQQMKHLSDEEAEKLKKTVKRKPIYLILEDIYDTYNVGGFFRLAEALAAEKVYLCGSTPIPPNPKIRRASMGAHKLVSWEHKKSAAEAIGELRKIKKMQVIAVEQSEKSVDYRKAEYGFLMAFIFGNETYGVKKETLDLADEVVEIPMYGLNRSLNAMVAAGIVMFWGCEKIKNQKSKKLRPNF